jgi:RHS repeat-associated protein
MHGDVNWALTDHQGSVRDVIDSQGNLLNHISYDGFGNVTRQTNANLNFRFGYTGREFDQETGLHYYRARYYDASIGRFISEDPVGFGAGDTNLYRYVGNSPTNFVDPDGQYALALSGGGLLLAGAFAIGGTLLVLSSSQSSTENFDSPSLPTVGFGPHRQLLEAIERSIQRDIARNGEVLQGGSKALQDLIQDRFEAGDGAQDEHKNISDSQSTTGADTENPCKNNSQHSKLVQGLAEQGIKHTPKDIVRISQTSTGKTVFLEKGTSRAGLEHIIKKHGADFAKRGISEEQIPDIVITAVTKGKVVGYQGRNRPIYEIVINGIKQRIAATVSNNGFIVGANPAK